MPREDAEDFSSAILTKLTEAGDERVDDACIFILRIDFALTTRPAHGQGVVCGLSKATG